VLIKRVLLPSLFPLTSKLFPNKQLLGLLLELEDFENKMVNRYGSFSVKRIREFKSKQHKEYYSFKVFCYDTLENEVNNPDARKNTIKTHKTHLKTFFEDFYKNKLERKKQPRLIPTMILK